MLDESFDNGLEEGEEPLKRVQIECLDLDWIFDGDNAKILLSVLASEAIRLASEAICLKAEALHLSAAGICLSLEAIPMSAEGIRFVCL